MCVSTTNKQNKKRVGCSEAKLALVFGRESSSLEKKKRQWKCAAAEKRYRGREIIIFLLCACEAFFFYYYLLLMLASITGAKTHDPASAAAFIESQAKYIRIYYYDSSNLLYCGSHYLHAGNCRKKQGSFYYYFKECDVKLTAGGFIDDVKLVNRLRFRSRWANLAADFRLDFYDHLRKNDRGRLVCFFFGWENLADAEWQTHAANVRSFCSEMMKDFWKITWQRNLAGFF